MVEVVVALYFEERFGEQPRPQESEEPDCSSFRSVILALSGSKYLGLHSHTRIGVFAEHSAD